MVKIPFFRSKQKSNSANPPRYKPDGSQPTHVAIIMDGNNRWARNNRPAGKSGHSVGAEVIRKVLSACQQANIGYLTLFAFSSENWLRPEKEVQELMKLLEQYLRNEVAELSKEGVRLRFIGRRDRLDAKIVQLMDEAEKLTASNLERTLILAIDYGGRWDICRAAQKYAEEFAAGAVKEQELTEELFADYMSLSDIPPPDLCIRTGGEQRISNFLLWDLAYAELYFTECLWPSFDEAVFFDALDCYATRQRRYGKTSEQVETEALS